MSYPDPRYLEDQGAVSAVLRRADAPPELQLGSAGSAGYVATGTSTNGQFDTYWK